MIEDLQSMTQGDLVRRVQELQEDVARLKAENEEKDDHYKWLVSKFTRYKNAVKSVALLDD